MGDTEGARGLGAGSPRLGRRSLAILHGLMGREASGDDGRPPGSLLQGMRPLQMLS
jgi:hypothetical protein